MNNKKTGKYFPCLVCGTPIYHLKSQIEKNIRKCCSRECQYKNPIYIEKQNKSSVIRSEKQKENHRNGVYNYDEILKKRNDALLKNGKKSGRKSGYKGKKTGDYFPCPICGVMVYYLKSQIEKNIRKCCSRECLFKDSLYLQKLKNVDKSYMKSEKYSISKSNMNLPHFKKYNGSVRRLSEKVYNNNLNKINPDNYIRTLCGVRDGYQLDHIKSVKQCWNEGLSIEEASDISNLCIISWRDNLNKRTFEPVLEYGNSNIEV